MQKMDVSAIATRNRLGEPNSALADMRFWGETVMKQGAELILFPEFNLTGYIQHAIACQFAEPIPGPSTEKVVRLAGELGAILSCGLIEKDQGKTYCTQSWPMGMD